MTRLRNELVLEKWKDGESAASHNGALHTDGTSLFSYNLKIGHRADSGATIVGDFTSPGGTLLPNDHFLPCWKGSRNRGPHDAPGSFQQFGV